MRALVPALVLAIMLAGLAVAETADVDRQACPAIGYDGPAAPTPDQPAVSPTQSSADKSTLATNYEGKLRVYIVEPLSRWYDYNYNQYDYGFLDFAIDEAISIPYLDTYQTSKVWTAPTAYNDITEDNIMAIAVVCNTNEAHTGYSDPPSGSAFTAYYTDAAAGARPGETSSDTAYSGYTHTVFVEEATGTY